MPALVALKSLTFSNGTKLSLEPDSIVVLVGPNNAGKSQLLRDICQIATAGKPGIIAKAAEVDVERSREVIEAWAKNHLQPDSGYILSGLHGRIPGRTFSRWPDVEESERGDAVSQWIHLANCESRLATTNIVKSINYLEQPLESPIHELQRDWSAWRRVSDITYRAFQKHIAIDHLAGPTVELRLDDSPPPSDEEGLPLLNPAALKAWRSRAPELRRQGDGVRSFVGSLLHALAMDWSITLIDEPEAFLHPPQARLLGQVLAAEVPLDRQLFIATHSADFVRGLLDVAENSNRVQIVRLSRVADSTTPSVLKRDDIITSWNDPIFLFSNLIEGLFHEAVVICESDGDCRFYSAIAAAPSTSSNVRLPDILWIWSGGKDRMPGMVESLAALRVPVCVVGDFDIIREGELLKKFAKVLGFEWLEIESQYRTIKSAIETSASVPALDSVKKEVRRILEDASGRFLTEDVVDSIRSAIKYSSPWSSAKKSGAHGLPQGDATTAWAKLRATLEEHRLFVVPVGELERFLPSVPNHGPRWLRTVLENYQVATAPELRDAREFVALIIAACKMGNDLTVTSAVDKHGKRTGSASIEDLDVAPQTIEPARDLELSRVSRPEANRWAARAWNIFKAVWAAISLVALVHWLYRWR